MPLQRPYSELRASDAERERVVAFLREHALAGRLNDEELEERIGLAYAAVTVGDLERLIADLPARPPARPAPAARAPPPPPPRPNFKPVLMVCGALFLALTVGPIVLGLARRAARDRVQHRLPARPVLPRRAADRPGHPPPPARPPPSMRWGPQY